MNKRFRLIKSKIATILVVLMCINSFAAVVGDNDGAAFITKAEFESLKNDFQTQINRYNTSLDSKIDGAIASYLNGVTLAAQSKIYMIDNVRHFKDINDVTNYNGRVKLVLSLSSVDAQKNSDANWTMGYEGSAKINTSGTIGQGVMATTVNTADKIYVIGKLATFSDTLTATIQNYARADRGPIPGVSGRVGVWQLWWKVGGTGYDQNTYLTSQQFDDLNFRIWPECYGKDTNIEAYNSGGTYAIKPWLYAHNRVHTNLDNNLGFSINDETIRTLYDDTYYNGVEVKRDASLTNSTIDGFFKIVNNGFSTRTNGADNNNPMYREWTGHTDIGWTLIGDESSNIYLGMWKQVTSWNSVARWTNRLFDGANKELYVATISNPNRVFAGNYTSDNWVEWAKTITDEDKVRYEQKKYLWNIRYGNLLFAEDVTGEATFTVGITNNKSTACYIKFITNPTTKNFDSAQGIKTTKSDSTNKEAVKIDGNKSVTLKFTIEDKVPVFFKLSKGAEVTFDEFIVKEG